MQTVTLAFQGEGHREIAQRFYTWLMDGGLEDHMIDTLSTDEVVMTGICGHQNDRLEVAIGCHRVALELKTD